MSENEHNRIPNWYREIFPAGPSDGWYHKAGDHAASFVDRGKAQLVVSFDNLSDAGYPHPDIEPWAEKFVRDNGWSHMGVYARGPSWYRDKTLIAFLEGLRDDSFFERFDKVSLIGTSMGGFAALTFSCLCPGATVVALSPQSTLDLTRVPWENRFVKAQTRDWKMPYSDAAENIADLNKAYVLYDPFFEPDKKQVMRLPQDKLVHLKGFGFGHKTAVVLRRMEQLKQVMQSAIEGNLTPTDFQSLSRKRKDIYLYRLSMEAHLAERGKDARIAQFRAAFRQRRRAADQSNQATSAS